MKGHFKIENVEEHRDLWLTPLFYAVCVWNIFQW
jgi:hypothetical protein